MTSTRGMGTAILAAIAHGATDLILTVGGSSSNDGGAGLAASGTGQHAGPLEGDIESDILTEPTVRGQWRLHGGGYL